MTRSSRTAPIHISILATLLVSLVAMATPASAAPQEIVMTAPYASQDSGTTCGETGWCMNDAAASTETGDLSVKVEVLGAHGGAEAMDSPTSTATASLTATHTVPDLRDSGKEVESIHYHIDLSNDEVILAALVGVVEYSAKAVHSSGVKLEGAEDAWQQYVGGFIVAEEHEKTFALTVRGVNGAPIPPGEMEVTAGLAAILGGSHTSECQEETCVTVGGAAGAIDTSAVVDRIVATIDTRPA